MTNIYYGVMSEFYDDGTVKACMIYSNGKSKPKNSSRELPFADCYKDWYDTEQAAKIALNQCFELGARAIAQSRFCLGDLIIPDKNNFYNKY